MLVGVFLSDSSLLRRFPMTTSNQETNRGINSWALALAVGFIALAMLAVGCGSGVDSSLSSSVTSDPCLAAGITLGEAQAIMDAAWYDANVLYTSYYSERQTAIDACWNSSVSTYQANNCVACVVPLVDYVYAQ